MSLASIKALNPFERVVYFIKERESIRLKKGCGDAWPWTDDPILRNYRFCNVRRMDDKVSRWLFNNWYVPYVDHPNLLVAATMARHFNTPEALEEVGFPDTWRPKEIKAKLRAMKAKGCRIFNGAYMVRGIGTTDKTEMVIDYVCQPLVDEPPKLDTTSMQRSVEALLPYWGMGDFIAGQIIGDLRWALSGTWEDKQCWAAIGPGSRKGINLLLNRPIKAPMGQKEFEKHLTELIKDLITQIPGIMQRLEAIDIQNCCCEFFKYTKALTGVGKPKQRYHPKT
jgi:hypothetical protein